MLDLRAIHENPDAVIQALDRRGDSHADAVRQIVEADRIRREGLTEVNDLKAERNTASKQIGELKRAGQDAEELIAGMKTVGDRIGEIDARVAESEARIEGLLIGLPNLPLDSVPDGDASNNVVEKVVGEAKRFDFTPRPHWELAEALDILDMPRGAKISGSGFPVLKARGARLQRALIDFFLDRHTEANGYTELRLPYLVTTESLTGTGQLPKFAEESYHTARDDLWLIPTAEVPITNMHRDEILERDEMPVRYTGYSPCFRREAGAAGKDTRGLLRVHQFDKVELVRCETPERGAEALEEMTREAEELLEDLGLHFRRVKLATGDLGFSSAMTFDLEVWSPGVEQWLEVSSISLFTDFQARRANLRFREEQAARPRFVYTLNGSALALPRTVAALLETWQEDDGSVTIPPKLSRFTGFEQIGPPSGLSSV